MHHLHLGRSGTQYVAIVANLLSSYCGTSLVESYCEESSIFKQLLDEVFVISGIIKVEVSVISRSRRLRLITLAETLIIPDITKTESNNCFIIHCFEENNDKRIIAAITVYFQTL